MEYSLNIALIEPEIPQNTGNIARTCAATGARLHLVGPMGFTITDKQVKRAGLDYWDKLDITFYDSQEEFFEKNKGADFYYFSTKAEIAHSDMELRGRFPRRLFSFFRQGNQRTSGRAFKGKSRQLRKASYEGNYQKS